MGGRGRGGRNKVAEAGLAMLLRVYEYMKRYRLESERADKYMWRKKG